MDQNEVSIGPLDCRTQAIIDLSNLPSLFVGSVNIFNEVGICWPSRDGPHKREVSGIEANDSCATIRRDVLRVIRLSRRWDWGGDLIVKLIKI